MSASEPPSHRYYRAMHGSWRGRLSLAITDRAALDAASTSTLDRLAWKLTATMGRMLGPPWLETRVDYLSGAARNEVVHTTRVRQLGMTAVHGVETISLDPDGRRFTLRGAHRFAWAPWHAQPVTAEGEIAEAADGARYVFEYLGATLTQTTRRDGEDALVVTQTTAFSRSEVRLVRFAR